uniref:Variant surface glycoprotein 741 n=1 Tax=Trypanosoma brucei TaxID=5691 RepID=M4SV85_9TRYP|nr:variant surface glycoprotein 741 [Trypanosoma brucei]
MYKQLLILLALSVKLAQSADDVTVGGNRQAYSALCGIVALAEGDINVPPEPAITSDDYYFVQLLNLSSSGDEWQKMFYTNDTPKKVHNTAEAAGQGKKGYEEYWEDWKKAAEQLLTTPTPPRLEATGISKLTPAQRKLAHGEIAKLAGKAIQIKKQIDGLEKGKIDAASAAATVKTAVYGAGATTAASTTLVSAFGADPDNSARDTVCEAGSGNQKVKTVAAALACLCMKAAGGGAGNWQDSTCTKKADGSTGWDSGSSAPNIADIKTALKACPKRAQEAARSADLTTAVDNVLNNIEAGESDGYIGHFVTTGCNGSKGNGICVKITGYTANPAAAIAKVPWIHNIQELATELNKREVAAQEIHRLNQMLKLEAEAANAIIAEAKEAPEMALSITAATPIDKENTAATNCNKHKSNKTTCESTDKCKWEAKDGKSKTEGTCKPKEGEGETNSGTGESTSKCTSLDTEDKCEAVQGRTHPGKKYVCGWMEEK